jgi:hypothetical protein
MTLYGQVVVYNCVLLEISGLLSYHQILLWLHNGEPPDIVRQILSDQLRRLPNDVKINIGDEKIACSEDVLTYVSPFFKAAIKFKKSRPVEIPEDLGFGPVELHVLVNFAYTGHYSYSPDAASVAYSALRTTVSSRH